RNSFWDLLFRWHMCSNIEHGQIRQVLKQAWNKLGREPRGWDGTHTNIGLARSSASIAFILLGPLLDHAIAGQCLLGVLPAKAKPAPKGGIIAVPVVVKSKHISPVMRSRR